MDRLCFASDNASGVHPKVLRAIEDANTGYSLAYGADAYSARVIDKLRTAFDSEAEILFTFGGTGANVIAIGSLARAFEAVFCSDCSHIWSDECAAPQKYFGGKIVPIPSELGKITPRTVAENFGPARGVHHARPRIISITQPTELGTLYSVDEIRALAQFAHQHDLYLHVDGARLSNAAAALETSLAELTHKQGVDVLSFGGTKNGLMAAEAVIYFSPNLAEHAEYVRKQTTQLASKMRFIAAQFDALFTDDLWLKNARVANSMMTRLVDSVANIPQLNFAAPAQINASFPILTAQLITTLQKDCDFYTWDEGRAIARWMTSFNTTSEQVDRFATIIHAAFQQ